MSEFKQEQPAEEHKLSSQVSYQEKMARLSSRIHGKVSREVRSLEPLQEVLRLVSEQPAQV